MRRLLASGVLAAASLGPLAAATALGPHTYPDPPTTPNKVWLALGDSYSSGEGLMYNDFESNPPDKNCERATGYSENADAVPSRAYSRVAYDELGGINAGWDYRLLACTGDRSQDIANQLAEWTATDQRTADLVTVSIGGNNIGFSDVIMACTGLSQQAPYVNSLRPRCDVTSEELNGRIDALVTAGGTAPDGGPNLFDMYVSMANRSITSGGHVVVLGYPRPVADPSSWKPFQGSRCFRVHRDDVAMLRAVSDHFTAALSGLVERLNALPNSARNGVTFEFVHVAADYEPPAAPSHGLCGPDPWLNGIVPGISGSREPGSKFRFQRSFHPNQHGHDAVGTTVRDVVAQLDWSQLGLPPVDVTTTTTTVLETIPAPGPVDAAVARFLEWMHAYGNGDLDTYCTIAAPAVTQFFGPISIEECASMFASFPRESPDVLASIAAARVDVSQVVAEAPDRVAIPALAVVYPTPVDEPGGVGDSVIMGLVDGQWYVVSWTE